MNLKQTFRKLAKVQLTLYVLCAIISVSTSCSKQPDQPAPQEDILRKLDSLNDKYLSGTLDEARHSQEEAVKIIAAAHLGLHAEANAFSIAYAKLYVLEMRSGNERAAEGYLVKARYWYLRGQEVNNPRIGDPPVEEALISSRGPDMREFNAQRFADIVDRLDTEATRGGGPAYKLHLPLTAQSPPAKAAD